MFDKEKFSNTLKKINDTYDTMSDFAKKACFDRTYISKYINMKLDNPPTPKILEKISDSSHGIVSYYDLLIICGYLSENVFSDIHFNSTKDILNNHKNELFNLGLNDSDINNIILFLHEDYIDRDNFLKEFSKLLKPFPDKNKEKIYKLIFSMALEIGEEIDNNAIIKNIALDAYSEAVERQIIKDSGKEELIIGLSRENKDILTDEDKSEITKFAEYVANRRKEGK